MFLLEKGLVVDLITTENKLLSFTLTDDMHVSDDSIIEPTEEPLFTPEIEEYYAFKGFSVIALAEKFTYMLVPYTKMIHTKEINSVF